MKKGEIPLRSEIAAEHTWNAPSVFESYEVWEAEFERVEGALQELEKFRDRLAEGPSTLVDALQVFEQLTRRIGNVVVYARMSHSVDTTDQAAAGANSRVQGLQGKALAAGSFIRPELLSLGEETLRSWMQSEPRLAVYQHFIEDIIRKQDHICSAEVEGQMGLLADPFKGISNTIGMLTNADFSFAPAVTSEGDEIQVTQGTYNRILSGADREARRTAWRNYADTYLEFQNTLAGGLATSIKQNVFKMRARGHQSTLEAALFNLNIPVSVFHNLINTFQKNLPTWHRYWAIRRKALGVDTLHPYDIWAPLTTDRPEVSYSQAVEWICEGLAPLGDEYVRVMRKGCLEDRWVDIYPNRGKRKGAFSSGRPGTHPFIMMSFNDTLFSLSTLAHELGHSMHSYLTWQNQPVVYGDYSLFVAEVASNFHQVLVRASLFEGNPEPAFQISLIEEAMANFYRYFLVMPTLARFELETHERVERGESLTAEVMIDRMADLFREAYGEEMQVDRDRVGITWAQFGHLYIDYYVYAYATGISAAHALANRVLSGESGAVEDYLGFLRAGGSVYPLDALKAAGVDLSKPGAVEETFDVLSGMVDRLEGLLAR